jgi:hypothetical protein
MIFERTIRVVCQPDPLEVAKARVQTRVVGQIIRERREGVLSALRASRSVPTAPASDGCSRQVAS